MLAIKNLPSAWRLLPMVLALAVLVAVLAPFAGSGLALAKGGEWKPVTLIYTTDIKGKIEPCG